MYERNAIVLERYFNQMFGYNMKSNIKTNFKDYCDLIECLEKYKEISDEEENIIQEYDTTANRIMEIQKRQEALNKKNIKFQDERFGIFQTIDESSDFIQRKFDTVNSNILEIDDQIKQNAQDFISAVTEFNEKSKIRTECGKSRRKIETDYNKMLNKTLDDYKDINIDIEKKAKQFIDTPTEEIEEELKEKIKANGEKEKIPFNMDVIKKAISLSVDIQKRETEILASIYDKTSRLFTEIKNNNTKSERHKKTIKDAKSKLEFVGALKEYLIQFLDNERLTAVNGEEEHNKLMKEACENLDEDLTQINNLYTLLLKEITKKITKKSYAELYNYDYLISLENKADEFDNEIKKLNLPVTIINPNYWRIEGMKKIYDVFNNKVTEEYGRDLSEYMPKEESEEIPEEEEFEDDIEEETEEEIKIKEKKVETKEEKKEKKKSKKETENDEMKAEIDKKIDMILGFGNGKNNNDSDFEDDEDEDWDEEEDEKDEEDEEGDEDTEEDFEEEISDDDFMHDDFIDDDEIEEKSKAKVKNTSKSNSTEDDWENEFVNIDKKDKTKKKKSFFDKFRK